jgi:hypothetical protein
MLLHPAPGLAADPCRRRLEKRIYIPLPGPTERLDLLRLSLKVSMGFRFCSGEWSRLDCRKVIPKADLTENAVMN